MKDRNTGESISRFLPTPSQLPAECERHYVEVHVPMAQNLLRPMRGLISYHVDRAIAQADVAGGWRQQPRGWRFVVLRFADDAALAFTPEQNEMVARDHVNCLYRLRHTGVEETVTFDRICGQFALAKFMIEADLAPDAAPRDAVAAFAALADRVRALMDEDPHRVHRGVLRPPALGRGRARRARRRRRPPRRRGVW